MIIDLPNQDGNLQTQVASPIKLSGHAPEYSSGGSPLGWHTREILIQIGYAKEEIDLLIANKVAAEPQ